MSIKNGNLFVVNKHIHYFEVVPSLSAGIDKSKLVDCKVFDNESDMYDYIASKIDVDRRDLAGSQLVVNKLNTGDIVAMNDRCDCDYIEGSLEDFISTYLD